MNWDRVEGDWKQFKGKIKEKWGNLTDDDLDRVAGRREQLEGLIQERYGIEKESKKGHQHMVGLSVIPLNNLGRAYASTRRGSDTHKNRDPHP
jgi:uncharacterized protein YjbJ (UPF0337 family)